MNRSDYHFGVDLNGGEHDSKYSTNIAPRLGVIRRDSCEQTDGKKLVLIFRIYSKIVIGKVAPEEWGLCNAALQLRWGTSSRGKLGAPSAR